MTKEGFVCCGAVMQLVGAFLVCSTPFHLRSIFFLGLALSLGQCLQHWPRDSVETSVTCQQSFVLDLLGYRYRADFASSEKKEERKNLKLISLLGDGWVILCSRQNYDFFRRRLRRCAKAFWQARQDWCASVCHETCLKRQDRASPNRISGGRKAGTLTTTR